MKSGMVWTVLSGLVILSMLLLACAPAAAPTPRPATPTPVPAPAASPAAAPGPTATPAPPLTKPVPTVAPSLPPAPAAKPAEEKPRYGGVLTMVQKEDAAHFDTHQMLTIHISHWVDASYSTLIQHDPRDDTKLIPDLAERWEISPDGKVFTFYLRKGVKFHDGKPATSADVKLSMERLAWPPKGILSHPQAMFAGLDKVETPDDHTVKLYLQYPKASFLELLAAPFTAIYPKHVVEQKGDMKKDIVGTGPFKLKSYTRGVVFEQEKFADYFIPGRPYMDGIKRYVIKDSAAIFAALRTGQVLFAGLRQHAVTSREQEILKKEVPGVAIQFVAVPNGTNLGMNLKRKPWDDVRVRKAASLAIDRRVGIQLLREGAAELGGYMPPGQWGIPEEELVKMPGYRADRQGEIAEAKKLLAEAGFPNGFKSKILTRNYKDYIDA
ncbi:MAG: ABC transporter substrate-binding protein, partial [Chloroflexota bacterium]|nr:ABC transporter substrate-binding protein [Chloroflexota bacterium]